MKNISMTYDEYENILEAIDNMVLPDDYVFPTAEEAQNMLLDCEPEKMKGVIVQLMTVLEKTDDKELSKALDDLIKDNVEFTEEAYEDSMEITSENQRERVMQIIEKIKLIDFQFPNFCPSKTEIDKIAKKDLAKDNNALGFLIWVSMLGDAENASENVKDVSAYTKKVLETAYKLM